MHRIYLTILFAACALLAQSQDTYTIQGSVIDGSTNEAIPFATVMLKSSETDGTLGGTTTENDGSFTLEAETQNVYLLLRFMGYKDTTFREITFVDGVAKVGQLELISSVQDIGPVQVQAEKSTMEFKLDKRVYNIGKDISSTGMGALEVLNNVPSVNVDIEGQVSLRGNAGVQILINGKPSVMSDDPANALGSLTADMIERVEIITNPSAKYEAGGTSGIINIILKKEENKGLNGSISLNTGWPNNHSLGGSVNYRTEKFNFFTQFGGGYRTNPRYREGINRNLLDSTSVESDGYYERNEQFYNVTLGADYYLNDYNTITLSGNFAYEIENSPSSTEISIFDSQGALESQFIRTEETSALNPKYQYDLNYSKEFKNNKEHTLNFSTLGRFFGKDQESQFGNDYLIGNTGAIDQRTETYFYQADYTFKLDYLNPLNDNFTLELGSQYDINDVGNDYAVRDLDSTGEYVINEGLTNNFQYVQKVLGAYGTGSYENDKWGLKLGLRVENTDLQTLLENTGEDNRQLYTNLFPTVHSSYKFSKRYSLQAGYSRRIFRPRLWDLNPFFNIQNNYSIRTGNPNLLPEFADSYEITGIFIFDKVSLNAGVYHLYTTNVRENISYFEDNVNISTRVNVGTQNKTGLEINGKWRTKKWLTIMGDFNYGYFSREGEFQGTVFDFKGDQWSSQLNFKFDLKWDIDLEVTPQYQSRLKTVQGEQSGFLYSDVGIRKKLWKGRGVVNLAVRDVFASRIRETIVDQETFYVYNFAKRGRFITLGFSYSFGKGEAMSYSGGGYH